MIVEFLGPMAVGKSTVAPLVAERLGIAHYQGQAFHGLHNEPLTAGQQWVDRVGSVLRNPMLLFAVLRAGDGSLGHRVSFALNMCRRNRFASQAAHAEDGVIESGPVHALCQEAAWAHRWAGNDATRFAAHIAHADVYVRLYADAVEVTRRLSTRTYMPTEYVESHDDWIVRYDSSVSNMLAVIGRPIIEVDANDSPQAVAGEVVRQLRRHLWLEPGSTG